MVNVVAIKIIALRINETAAKCRKKMARSTDAPKCTIALAKRKVNCSSRPCTTFYYSANK